MGSYAKGFEQSWDGVDLEIILVANGKLTADDLRRYLYLPGNVRTVEAPFVNMGQMRNLMVQKAAGDYVYFLDCDDWLAPGFSSALKNIDCDIAYGTSIWYCTSKKPEEQLYSVIHQIAFAESEWPLRMASVINKKVFEKYRFYEERPTLEDFLFFTELKLAGGINIKYVPELMQFYRQHSDSLKRDFQAQLNTEEVVKGLHAKYLPNAKRYDFTGIYKDRKAVKKMVEEIKAAQEPVIAIMDKAFVNEIPIMSPYVNFEFVQTGFIQTPLIELRNRLTIKP